MSKKKTLKENPNLVELGKEASKSSTYVVYFPKSKKVKNNSIKITRSNGEHVLFSNLDLRQLDLLEQVEQIIKIARNKKLTDKEVGFAIKMLCRSTI